VTKLPQITLAFWIMKIAATTLGETAGDLLAQTLKVGYLTSSLILVSLFLVSLVTQLKARKFHPALYWAVILSTSTAGTTMSDFMNRSAGLGYTNGALVLLSLLAGVFVLWKYTGNSFDVANISTFRGELLYWVAILISNTLGTSLGDFLADDSGLGFGGAALLISGVLLLVVVAKRFTPISSTLLFWIAFVLTRPLGASAGDFFSKPTDDGGLGYGTVGASLILGGILVSMIGYSYWQLHRKPARTDPLTEPIEVIGSTRSMPRSRGIRSGYYDPVPATAPTRFPWDGQPATPWRDPSVVWPASPRVTGYDRRENFLRRRGFVGRE